MAGLVGFFIGMGVGLIFGIVICNSTKLQEFVQKVIDKFKGAK